MNDENALNQALDIIRDEYNLAVYCNNTGLAYRLKHSIHWLELSIKNLQMSLDESESDLGLLTELQKLNVNQIQVKPKQQLLLTNGTQLTNEEKNTLKEKVKNYLKLSSQNG